MQCAPSRRAVAVWDMKGRELKLGEGKQTTKWGTGIDYAVWGVLSVIGFALLGPLEHHFLQIVPTSFKSRLPSCQWWVSFTLYGKSNDIDVGNGYEYMSRRRKG